MTDTLTQEHHEKTIFGFWVYLMTDCLLFAAFFATYAVLHKNTFGGPPAKLLFNLPFTLGQTIVLLTSCLSCGFASVAAASQNKNKTLSWLLVTFLFGSLFLGMELFEFMRLIDSGNSWQRSGFLSSFFTLTGIHGMHIAAGLLWILIMLYKVIKSGFIAATFRRLACLRMFWHFLNIVWVFIFTLVYLLGALE